MAGSFRGWRVELRGLNKVGPKSVNLSLDNFIAPCSVDQHVFASKIQARRLALLLQESIAVPLNNNSNDLLIAHEDTSRNAITPRRPSSPAECRPWKSSHIVE